MQMTLHHLANIQELKYKKKQYSLPDSMEKTVDTMIVCKEQGLDIGVVPSDFTETVLNYKNNKTKLECIVLDSFYKKEK